MGWNYDMSAAPRGHTEIRVQTGPKGQNIEKEVFIPAPIIACDKTGQTVTKTHWIPATDKTPGRWQMFGTQETPLAWQPWPEHPALSRARGDQ